jgi:hypothetical protein
MVLDQSRKGEQKTLVRRMRILLQVSVVPTHVRAWVASALATSAAMQAAGNGQQISLGSVPCVHPLYTYSLQAIVHALMRSDMLLTRYTVLFQIYGRGVFARITCACMVPMYAHVMH